MFTPPPCFTVDTLKRTSCTKLTNVEVRSSRLTSALVNRLAGDRLFVPPSFTVQGDCFAIIMDAERSHDLLLCEERLPSSPVLPSSDSYMEYDDLPDLQEVQEEAGLAGYQLGVGVSHQERHTQPLDTHWLTQLAHIATECADSSLSSSNLHSYARPPPLPSSTLSPPRGRDRPRTRRSRERVSTRSSSSQEGDKGWSFSCPPTAWHCFLKGTRLRFHTGSNVEWQDVEDLDNTEEDCGDEGCRSLKSYGSEGLQLLEHSETVLSGQAVLQLTFDPGALGHAPMTARCQLDHPFYVKNKGWSSFHPSLTVVHYGIPCYEVEVGDVCLPPGHREAKHTDDSLVFDTFRSYDFTPLDSSAVYVLSSMARRRQASHSSVSPDRDTSQGTAHLNICCVHRQKHQQTHISTVFKAADAHSPGPSHSPCQKTTKSQQTSAAESNDAPPPNKCKRPMNAFMLFAKKFRVEYTQMYPGKDNRAISVLLGEQWKKMRSEERRTFTVQAKALADEQKRLNPDCWKRKRTNSQGCQGN
ncbi:HMG box-containing protein 1-like isoform X3 [Cottoperca gobio]|uniref:HMG box-containing protein 1 n=1 Tax=Cottoperca gobio TaxID=56716 RepID=A0A6J2S858_COTGO|nr:HMG box-containing protein 1-like isoform X3 [Cottoperca gobio]